MKKGVHRKDNHYTNTERKQRKTTTVNNNQITVVVFRSFLSVFHSSSSNNEAVSFLTFHRVFIDNRLSRDLFTLLRETLSS
jgi:hypothetical protein